MSLCFAISSADVSWMVPVIGLAACGVAFLVGRLFLPARQTTIPVEEEEALDDSFLRGVTQDRRALPRRRGNSQEVELSKGSEEPPVRGWVVDRAQGGIGVLVDAPVPRGTALKVRPLKTDKVAWIDVTIRFCRREGAQYELGCQFHRTPNWNELLLFG